LSGLDLAFLPAVLLTSLAGSLHCVGMCGGLALAAGRGRIRSQIWYHAARGSAYLALGALSARFGRGLFLEAGLRPLQILFAVVLLGAFVFILVKRRLPGGLLLGSIASAGMKQGVRAGEQGRDTLQAVLIGGSSVFLPCGWLWAFVLLALSTGKPFQGAGVLFTFWIGTLPALLGSRILLQGLLARIGIRGTRMASWLLMLAAAQSVYVHWSHFFHEQKSTAGTALNCAPGSRPTH
jgi:hypothetical protein